MKADPTIQGDPDARFEEGADLDLVVVTTAGSTPGTQVLRLDFLEPFAQVVAFRHLHSIATPPDPAYGVNKFVPADGVIPSDPRDAALWPLGTPLRPSVPPQPGQLNLRTSTGAGGAVAMFFNITLRRGSLFSMGWQDTIGALREGKGSAWPDGTSADGDRIVDLLGAMAPLDWYSAAVGTANARNNGLRDLIDYQSAARARIFVPNHQTSGGNDVGETKSVVHQAIYLEQMWIMGIPVEQQPDVRWTSDPSDYLKPMVFDATKSDVRDVQGRRTQLRYFDRFPYAEGEGRRRGKALLPAVAARTSSGGPDVTDCC